MNVLILTMFVSLTLAGLGVALFLWSARLRTFEHSDRLSILPLEDDLISPPGEQAIPAPKPETEN